jgi:hypothetical protein
MASMFLPLLNRPASSSIWAIHAVIKAVFRVPRDKLTWRHSKLYFIVVGDHYSNELLGNNDIRC